MSIDAKTRACLAVMATALALCCAAGARATTYSVDVEGSFTLDMSGSGPIDLAPPVSFFGSFDVDTNVPPIEYPSNGDYTMTGYPDAAISNISITVFGTRFSTNDINDEQFVSAIPGSGVYFSENLYLGATPSIWMTFYTSDGQMLQMGQAYCGSLGDPSCGISPYLTYQDFTDPSGDVYLGSVNAVVVPEPAAWTLTLSGAALAGAGLRARRRRSARSSASPRYLAPAKAYCASRS
jgi:hypothetical protein